MILSQPIWDLSKSESSINKNERIDSSLSIKLKILSLNQSNLILKAFPLVSQKIDKLTFQKNTQKKINK